MATTASLTSIDPKDIPPLMTPEMLEWWILFGICVANKPAKITEQKLNSFFTVWSKHVKDSPFKTVKFLIEKNTLKDAIKMAKFGQYNRIIKAFEEAVKLDASKLLGMLPSEAVDVLEGIHGIGPKTARMIVLYSKPEADCVPLDTHVLKYLKSMGLDVPKNTPSAGPKYNMLEKAFQDFAKMQGKTVRELDTEVWKSYAL